MHSGMHSGMHWVGQFEIDSATYLGWYLEIGSETYLDWCLETYLD
jgi:hypothetical protein